MADIAKSGTPSLSSINPPQNNQIAGLLAGEAIAAGDLCYIKAADGRVWRSIGTAVNAAAKVDGMAAEACAVGEAVTIFRHVNFRYGAGLTPGARIFVGSAAGAIADAATTGGTAPIGFVVDATRVHVHGSFY